MKNQPVGLTEKRSNKRRLIPILAGIVGLCVPIYAFAYDQAACDACRANCQSNAGYYQSQCTQMYQGCSGSVIASCVSSMMNTCQSQCTSSAACTH